MFQGCRKSPGVSLLLVAEGQVHDADPPPPPPYPPPAAPQWGLEMTPQVGEMLPGMSVLPTHTVFLLFLPCLHLLVDSIQKQCFYAIHLLRAICRQF